MNPDTKRSANGSGKKEDKHCRDNSDAPGLLGLTSAYDEELDEVDSLVQLIEARPFDA